ncbi:alpha/beta fold hydrolase [Nocardia sp. NPDC050175]|uniref:alpha/beta fold hydrolase n=1 Tax=Nocardia sp. NPDC050175 TaxID=3364317 RepID=UPI0037AA8D24
MDVFSRSRAGRRRRQIGATIAAAVALAGLSIAAASADPAEEQPRHSFAEYQGIPISIFEYGPSADEAPTIVTTGGWPGDSSIFEPAARELAKKYHVVRYDRRGVGESGHELTEESNSLENLAGEFGAVLDKTAPGRPVHTFNEAWGSYIAAEYAYRNPGRIASLSAIGAPSLDLQHYAMAESVDHPQNLPGNLAYATWFASMSMPVLPELYIQAGATEAAFGALTAIMGEQPVHMTKEDLLDSVSIYRANAPARLLNPEYDYLTVPVMQVFQSPLDNPDVIAGLERHTNNLWVTEIEGGHANFGRTSWPLISSELDRAIATTEPGAPAN